VRPCLVAAVVGPSDPLAVVHAGHPLADRVPARRTVARTLARAHPCLDHVHAAPVHGGVRGRSPPHGVPGAAHGAGRDRSRWNPDRPLRDSDRRSHGADVRRGLGERIRPPPGGPRPPGEPPSAQARPPAARHIDRAALPSAIYPHALPVARNVSSLNRPAQHSGDSANGLRPTLSKQIKVVTCAREPNQDSVTSAAV
jgi:hypothetical protein